MLAGRTIAGSRHVDCLCGRSSCIYPDSPGRHVVEDEPPYAALAASAGLILFIHGPRSVRRGAPEAVPGRATLGRESLSLPEVRAMSSDSPLSRRRFIAHSA